MLSLNDHFDELRRLEAIQVNAGRRRADTADDRKLCAGACMTIEKAIKHPRPRWLSDRGSNGGDCDISWVINEHGFMVNEVLMLANWHHLS